MAEQIIPTVADASYSIDADLDNNICVFDFHWNETDQAWYMNFSNLTEGYVLNGIKLMPGCSILEPYATPELGVLAIIDTEDKDSNPDFDGFGDRYKLIYIPLEDIN